MKTHTTVGYQILQNAVKNMNGFNYLSDAADMAYCHHERWDGTGYPRGLKGEDIPLSARIMAVADVYDSLVSKRSYKEPMPKEEALKIIREERGTHFDPAVVDAFFHALPHMLLLGEIDQVDTSELF